MLRRSPRSSGFTLLELIVVIAILALIATMTIPRMRGSERREFNHAVDEVVDLLTMFAQRDSLSRRPIGLGLDVDRRRFELYQLDPADAGDGSQWRRDTLVRPQVIPDAIDLDALRIYVDDLPTSITEYPLSHSPGQQRPTIRIDLQTLSGRYRTAVVLAPHAVAPRRVDGDEFDLVPIDLDREGRSREDW